MADGVSGHHGSIAVSHVEIVFRSDIEYVTVLVQHMAVESVLAVT